MLFMKGARRRASACLCDYLDKGMNQANWPEVSYSSCTLFFWQQNNVGGVDNL